MPILDLKGAKRLEGVKPRRQRTLGDPGTYPAGLLNGSGGAGGFAGAKYSRLTQDFIGRNVSADQELFNDNRRLRARGRDVSMNNFIGAKFVQMWRQNVVGADGILVKSTITNQFGAETAETDRINKLLDQEWVRWCQPGPRGCSADGRLSFIDHQLLAIGNIAGEGENLTKLVYGRQFNDCGIALQALDNDQLDDSLMTTTGDGGEIRMGVEVDQYRRPVAYHLWGGHPNDMLPSGSRERKRVAAEFIVHTFMSRRPGQTRGYTGLAPAILAMNQYNRYEEAVVVAARSSASKFAVIERAYPTDGAGVFEDEDEEGKDTNLDGTQLMTANAGEIPVLDMGETLNFTDPRFPTNTHKDFTQTMLRNIASGLLVMYPSLANDLEGVNFSSIRAGLIDERDMWKIVQRFFSGSYIRTVRLAWVKIALLVNPVLQGISLTPQQQEQFSMRGRGWDWVDPQKDAAATILKLGEGLTTYEIECAKLGLDWQEVAKQRKKEQEFFSELGVVYGVDITGDQGGKGVAAGDEKEAAEIQGGGSKGGGGKGK